MKGFLIQDYKLSEYGRKAGDMNQQSIKSDRGIKTLGRGRLLSEHKETQESGPTLSSNPQMPKVLFNSMEHRQLKEMRQTALAQYVIIT